jgi:hypothetical protein
MRSLTFKDSINRINPAFVLSFIVTLLVSGTVIGSYPAKVSLAYGSSDSKSCYYSFSGLASKLSPATSEAKAGLANVDLITHSRNAGHGDIQYDSVYSPSPLNSTYSPSAISPAPPSFSSSPYSSTSTGASSPTRDSSSLIQITAGKIQDIGFSINNNNVAYTPNPLNLPSLVTNLAVSLVSQSPSVRILGPSSWNLPSISSGSGQELTTQVFASPSLIGNSVFFTVNVQYIENGHQVRTSSFDLGAIVIGDIQLDVNNLGIRYIGNTPNLVGNILNEGNTPAQFASVEMLTQGQGQTQLLSLPSSSNKNITATITSNSSQYLGNIGVNAPIPFNIPLQIAQIPIANAQQQNTTTRGTSENLSRGQYPVSLKITYSDDLKNIHDKVINSTISLLDVQSSPPPLGGTNNALPAAEQDTQLTSTNGFVDTYWAANTARITSGNNSISSTLVPTEQEVGPGEGQSILAVVLSNTAFSNINGIIGYLTLPSGFSAPVGGGTPSTNANPQQIATASFTGMVQSGQTYTLYFKVKIGKTATIGSHTATLRIYYFKVPELQPGQYSSQTFTIPFSLPGKVILDAVPKITSLNPGASNDARIQLVNKGTADAHSVIVTVAGISGNSISGSNVASSSAQTGGGSSNSSNSGNITTSGQTTTTSPTSSIPTVNLGARTFDIGTLPVNGTAEVDPIIYPSESAGGTLQNLNLQVSYSDANGNAKTSNFSVGYLVLPTPPEAGLSVTPFNGSPQSSSNSTSSSHPPSSSSYSNTTNLNNTSGSSHNNRNKSSSPSAGITVSPASESDSTAKIVNVNGDSKSNKYTTVVPAIYKITRGSNNTDTTSAVGSSPRALSHGSSTSNNTNTINNSNNGSTNSTALTLVSGSVQDMKFNVANNNNFPITHAVVSIASQSSDVKIVGDSLWSLPILAANVAHTFSTKIYASTSLIGSPVSFLVTLQYISGAQSKMGSFILGGNVVGDIKVSVTDVAVNYVAGVPNLVGNLLNRGNTIGLYTTVQLMNQPFSSNSSSSSTAVSGGQSVNQQHHIHNGGGVGVRSGGSTQSSSTNSSSSISSSLPPPQYLGDLQPDSPLPFSIPLGIDINSTAPGTYPVSVKVTYSDDLKNSHEIVLNSPVLIQPQQPRGSSDHGGGILSFLGIGGGGGSHGRGGHGSGGGNTGFFGIPFLYLIIIIAAIVIAAIYFRRRRRSKAAKTIASESEEGDDIDKEEDIESLIDSSKSGDSDKKGGSIGTSKQ